MCNSPLAFSSIKFTLRSNIYLKKFIFFSFQAKKLTPTKSVTQFALHFELPIRCVKGNTLCGYFIAEDDQKRKIKLIIPLTPLDSNQIYSQEQMETVSF